MYWETDNLYINNFTSITSNYGDLRLNSTYSDIIVRYPSIIQTTENYILQRPMLLDRDNVNYTITIWIQKNFICESSINFISTSLFYWNKLELVSQSNLFLFF